MTSRPVRWRHLAAVAAVAAAFVSAAPGALASSATAGTVALGERADQDAGEIVQRIDADLKNNDFDAAGKEIAALRQLAFNARTAVEHDPSATNRNAASALQNLADQQSRRVIDAKIDNALQQPTGSKQQGERYWEAVVANWIRPQVTAFNEKFRESPLDRYHRQQQGDGKNRDAEIDIETATAVIEVTAGEGSGKSTQILGTDKREGLVRNPLANPSGKPVIVFAPKGLKDQLAAKFQKAGIKVVSDRLALLDELAAVNTAAEDAKKKKQQERRANLGLKCPPGHAGILDGVAGVAPAAVSAAGPCGGNDGLSSALESKDLGGVDFSTLQMQYLSDPGSGGVKYSFSARPAAPGLEQSPLTGLDIAATSTADLRTWLVLDPSKFWVNLNPTQPDKIVDPQLGQTNAGRALLEADFAMKRTSSRLLDPNTAFGARYWRAFGKSGSSCYTSRFWIVPGDVQVREAGSSLYILKATLAVKAQSMHIDGLSRPCHSSPESDARNERLEQTMVVPKVAEALNTLPEYAPIRRAFLARVIAQWIRKRHQEGHPTSFDKLVDSGDLGPAKLQGGWRPKQVFDSYVHSIQDGEFTYHQTGKGGSITEIKLGGVDFKNVGSTAISAAQMDREHPRLTQTVRASGARPAAAPDGTIWLGQSDPAPDPGPLARLSNAMRSLVSSRTAIAVVLVVALIVATFGIRTGAGRRRPQA
ncbi:hypothetical protein AB0L00_23420 [Actinoallomurus sp. NPDC052308]|uniref:hypothetical protein n=1 Tax=Actinoallomurus sp. NPDC052308 TaxID=3155530 RepID=UPI003439A03E